MFERLKRLFRRGKTSDSGVAPGSASVTVGLDFGTCATKCVVNLESFDGGRDRFMALMFPSSRFTGGSLCLPTAIACEDGALVFGEEAEALPEDRVIRSFKMAIPCLECGWGTYEAPCMIRGEHGYFDLEGHRFSATDLATLYIAVVLRQVQGQIRRFLGQSERVSVYLNLAAPLNELVRAPKSDGGPTAERTSDAARDTAVSRAYIALGQRALALVESSCSPWPLEQAAAQLTEVRALPVASLDQSPAYVVPETLAAVAGFVNRPGTGTGHFMTFDVGAGSTDVSLFWLEKHDSVVKPWYYASRSLHVGMDGIDRGLSDASVGEPGESLRARREALQRKEGGLCRHRAHIQNTLEAIDKHRRTTFGWGYQNEKRPGRFSDTRMLLLGGGGRADVIRDIAQHPLWENVIGPPDVEVLDLDATTRVLRPDGREDPLEVADVEKEAYLLVVAEGLAHKIIDIPPFGVTTEPFLAPRQRTPVPPELWFATGRDETWGHPAAECKG